MPTYDYECRDCGHRFEAFQQITAAPLRKCPECGGKVRRLLGAGGAVIVKHSGAGASGYRGGATSCGRDAPCCGLDAPCDAPPCRR